VIGCEVSDRKTLETVIVITEVLDNVHLIFPYTLVDIGKHVGWEVELMI